MFIPLPGPAEDLSLNRDTATIAPELRVLKIGDEAAHFISPLEKNANYRLKRITDLLISLLLILVIFPWLVPLMAVMIKLSSKGPVFFVQKRNKKDGKIFSCIKFRTMIFNLQADYEPSFPNDPRITSFGRFLRRYHIDELPQLINVLFGDMSLVGPRPHMVMDNKRFENTIHLYHYRHKVKPGITGLAQVTGCIGPVTNAETMAARIEKDIHYIENWSLALDARILLNTILRRTSKL
jgi:putative colanic acid biosysnthesis UDP-glucose lipid carrier transferase